MHLSISWTWKNNSINYISQSYLKKEKRYYFYTGEKLRPAALCLKNLKFSIFTKLVTSVLYCTVSCQYKYICIPGTSFIQLLKLKRNHWTREREMHNLFKQSEIITQKAGTYTNLTKNNDLTANEATGLRGRIYSNIHNISGMSKYYRIPSPLPIGT